MLLTSVWFAHPQMSHKSLIWLIEVLLLTDSSDSISSPSALEGRSAVWISS